MYEAEIEIGPNIGYIVHVKKQNKVLDRFCF